MKLPAKTKSAVLRSQGAELSAGGVRYRTWSDQAEVAVFIVEETGTIIRTVPCQPDGGGYFLGYDQLGRAGDLYRYRLGADHWPDPASRWQPFGVHGPSMVVDPHAFVWTDGAWVAPAFRDLVIYELHVGTFTEPGTFRDAIAKLDHLVSLGVNAIELMPIADFPGKRNWGYDGVMPYAPARVYGNPADLRALVDAAHGRGLAVILDVVYNHLGPDGNYVGVFHGDYFHRQHETPWGSAFNLDAKAVRAFFAENATYWMREFHFDGFRLDATHTIVDTSEQHLLAEISSAVHAAGGFVVAEDERNEPMLLTEIARGGLGFDGCWSDDFHHVVRVMLTRDREGYYENFAGTPQELADTLEHGWLFRGQRETVNGVRRGGDTGALQAPQFIYCISNHDQVGNRAFGERLGHVVGPAAYRAASALLCLVPQTPMLFMGQEWQASTPFQFFTDHAEELGRNVTTGRRREFRHFAAFANPESLTSIPDPQAERTFRHSKLNWDELGDGSHAQMFQLYREFLQLRRTHPAWRDRTRGTWRVQLLKHGAIALILGAQQPAHRVLVVADLLGGHEPPELDVIPLGQPSARAWWPILSSNETRFGGREAADFQAPTTTVYELL